MREIKLGLGLKKWEVKDLELENWKLGRAFLENLKAGRAAAVRKLLELVERAGLKN